MRTNTMNTIRTAICSITASTFLAGSTLALAQDQSAAPPPADDQQQQQTAPPNGGWRKAGDAPPQPADAAPQPTMDPNYSQGQAQQSPNQQAPNQQYPNQQYPSQTYPAQQYPNQQYPNQQYPGQQYPRQQYPNQGYPQAGSSYNPGPVPAKLTIKPGTFLTVRLNQGLSSDRNQPGDAFAATLVRPVVVDGVVVAQAGQTVGGKVVEAKKAGRVEGVSHLGVQLTDLTLADGQPAPVQTQLFNRNGPTSQGRDAAAIGATTATGAAIGAAADWGRGAAIGAGAGALVGIVGVLLTRGHPTVLYPESVLTFRVEAPVTVSTEAAPQAFRYVSPGDYERSNAMQARMGPPSGQGYYASPGYYPYGYGYAYPYPYAYGYPYGYWGGFGLGWGGFYGRGFYGGGFRHWR
jgi:hypothetical protein